MLSGLRVKTFVDQVLTETEALSKTYKLIVKLTRQGPLAFRGDANKVEYLRNAVIGWHWAKEPLSRVGTMNLTFQQLHAELAASLQLENDTSRAEKEGSPRTKSEEPLSDVYYAGQGRYRHGSRPFKGSTSRVPYNPLRIQGCFNCGGQHLMKNCTKPIDTAKAAAQKIQYYAKKNREPFAVHSVLAELCAQLDATDSVSSDDDAINDHKIFQNMLQVHKKNPNNEKDEELNDTDSDSELEKLINDKGELVSTIHVVDSSFILQSASQTFDGMCVDSAAQHTVIGKQQAMAFCSSNGIEYSPKSYPGTPPTFSFGTHKHTSEGYILVRIPVTNDSFLSIKAPIVDINVPFLFGLENMLKYKIVLDVDNAVMFSKLQGWTLPLRFKNGHLYYEWAVSILFTESELRKVHNHFSHPEPDRLFSLFRRADPSSTSSHILNDLEKISSTCETCQREASAPHRFRVSLANIDIILNRENCLDLVKINGNQILHIVDRDTRFNAAGILKGESTRDVWRCYMEIWANKYIGFPDIISVDQGPQFQSLEWKSLLQLAGIIFKPSGVESHNAINVGERYHSYLRRLYNKIENANPGMTPDLILSMAVSAMNDTAGTNGLVPTLLVFGVLPRIPIIPAKLPGQVARLNAMRQARKELSSMVAKSKLKRALKMNIFAAASKSFKIGDEVLVYREDPINKWVGPFSVINVEGKMIHIDYNGDLKLFSKDKLKKYNFEGTGLPPLKTHYKRIPVGVRMRNLDYLVR